VVARLLVEKDGNLGQDPYSFLYFSPWVETDSSLGSSQPGHFTCLSDKLLGEQCHKCVATMIVPIHSLLLRYDPLSL